MKKSRRYALIFSALFPLICFGQETDSSDIIYQSGLVKILRLTEHVYQHISYLNSERFGRVDCNGMVVVNGKEAIILDTPVDDSSSAELIRWVREKRDAKIKAVIPTHFHEDCLGGIRAFEKEGVPVYATSKTIALAKERGFYLPALPFQAHMLLNTVGGEDLWIRYFGEGHTVDNVVVFFPKEQVLFGGCLIKSRGASKGNLADANMKEWPATVEKIQKAFPGIRKVIPGHGKSGDASLLEYTISLFKD